MSAQFAAVDYKQRAFAYMLKKEAKTICRSFGIDCIEKATPKRLKLSIPAESIFLASSKPAKFQLDVQQMGMIVAGAALAIAGDSPEVDRSPILNFQSGVIPSRSDVLKFEVDVKRNDGIAYARVAIFAKRGEKFELIGSGTRNAPEHRPSPPAAPSSSSSAPPPPQPTRQTSGTKRAAPPANVEAKRLAPTPSALASILATTSLAPPTVASTSNPPPPPSSAQLLAPTSSEVPASSPVAPASIVAVPLPPSNIRSIQILQDQTPMRGQRYSFINSGARKLGDIKGFNKKMKDLGVAPILIESRKMFFNARAHHVIYFDVKTDEEKEKVEKGIFDESEWTRLFSVATLSTNSPFLSRAMSMMEMFHTMMVASRIYIPKRPPPSRQAIVWNVEEIRATLKNADVMKRIEEKLNDEGFTMLGIFKRHLPHH